LRVRRRVYQNRLRHVYDIEHFIFFTWRGRDSLPPQRSFPAGCAPLHQAFAAMIDGGAQCAALHMAEPCGPPQVFPGPQSADQ
jgi:hypothetical protein